MLMAMFAMRKNNTEKAERYLMRIKDPDRALVRRERATYYFLIAALNSQKNLTESEKLFKRSLEIGLSRQEQAMAKLQLSAISMQKGRKREAEILVNEAKKLDKGNLLDEQITMIKQGLNAHRDSPDFSSNSKCAVCAAVNRHKKAMEEKRFSLCGAEYIELDKLLKILRLVESGGQAHELISRGLVRRDGVAETRKRAKLRSGDSVVFLGNRITVEP